MPQPAAHRDRAAGSCSTPKSAVAGTQYGRVRGYVDDGVLTFKGVPYGANTGGENRWLPARPPTPWDGEYPALTYGPNCPQRLHDWSSEQTFLQQWTDGWQSEDMLKLNVWTSSLSGKRPVMVYLHGGGYFFGSAYELASQDGAQMARHHDVVSVTVNHRLNTLGFFDVSSIGGSAYADSMNVGMTDLVAALRWVRDNIASFGGDPSCVMIYGQSGGGSKVTTLLGMPSAEGLIHRASAQSGGGGNLPTAEESSEFARRVIVAVDLVDASALLWRLHLVGQDVGGRSTSSPRPGWLTPTAALTRSTTGTRRWLAWGPGATPMSSASRATCAWRRRRRRRSRSGSARAACPWCRASRAFWRGDHRTATERLLPARSIANRFGGSHAQRDVIDWTLTEAALRAAALAHERLALKPWSPINLGFASRAGRTGTREGNA